MRTGGVTISSAGTSLRRATPTLLLAVLAALSMAPAVAGPAAASTSATGTEGTAASAPEASYVATQVSSGDLHNCALFQGGSVRCWGGDVGGAMLGSPGAMNVGKVGDDEPPGSVGPIDLGLGRTATQVVAGGWQSCALLDNGSVRCWGYDTGSGVLGRSAYAGSVGANETPGSQPPVNLGTGRTAVALAAGQQHTCAILDNGAVRCWGEAGEGRLGYGNSNDIGDNETPGSVAPVNLGAGRTATAITAGYAHTCAILDDGTVRCWGEGQYGELGLGNTQDIGDNEVPGSVATVNLGAGRTAVAIAAGARSTCAVLDNAKVRCWGYGGDGRLGYGNTVDIGDDEAPGSVPAVDVGGNVLDLATGNGHTCAILSTRRVRCWGWDDSGVLGIGSQGNWFGDDEAPSAAPLLDLGVGRTVTDISTSEFHTCVVLDNGAVRCWGWGADGRLGYGNTADIGDDETPGSIDPVSLGTSPNYRPDGVISYTGYGRIGDGTYPPDQQDAYAHARVGVAMTFTVTVQNDGTGDDRFVLRGEGSTSNLAYRYRVGSTDITGAVKNGTFLTPVIAPRGKFKVTVTATYRAGTPRYTQVFRRLTVSSHTFPARTDSVRAAVAQY